MMVSIINATIIIRSNRHDDGDKHDRDYHKYRGHYHVGRTLFRWIKGKRYGFFRRSNYTYILHKFDINLTCILHMFYTYFTYIYIYLHTFYIYFTKLLWRQFETVALLPSRADSWLWLSMFDTHDHDLKVVDWNESWTYLYAAWYVARMQPHKHNL